MTGPAAGAAAGAGCGGGTAARRLRILYVEPFDAGSHAAFTRTLTQGIRADWRVLTLPGRHWKWRMRGSAAWFALTGHAPLSDGFDVLLASSFLPLAELRGLVPALAGVPALLYFHENQLAYPSRSPHPPERDLHYGFTQLVAALSAHRCLFNSCYNRDSFLHAGAALLERMPDAVPGDWIDRLAARSVVTGYPLPFADAGTEAGPEGVMTASRPIQPDTPAGSDRRDGPVILWNHRWEHDKDPETFFGALELLKERAVPFRLIVCGERYRRAPAVFDRARDALADHILHWGTAPDRGAYEALLARAHIAVSTARQEFFGVAVMEAVWHGARPLVPDALSYPELFPACYRHPGDAMALANQLEALCTGWSRGELALRADRRELCRPHLAATVLPRLHALIEQTASGHSAG